MQYYGTKSHLPYCGNEILLIPSLTLGLNLIVKYLKPYRMGRKDWYYVHLPNLLIKRLDDFLKSPRAKSMGVTNKPELLRNLINEFLEKQESLYNRLETIPNFIKEIKPRDHFVLTYEDKPQFEEIVSSYVDENLRKNNIIALFISQNEERQFLNSLKEKIDVDRLINSGDITIIQSEDCKTKDGYSAAPCFDKLEQIKELATKKSKDGIALIGTLPGSLVNDENSDIAYDIETQVHKAVSTFEIPLTVICLYKSLPQNLENQFIECHDMIIKHSIVDRKSGLL